MVQVRSHWALFWIPSEILIFKCFMVELAVFKVRMVVISLLRFVYSLIWEEKWRKRGRGETGLPSSALLPKWHQELRLGEGGEPRTPSCPPLSVAKTQAFGPIVSIFSRVINRCWNSNWHSKIKCWHKKPQHRALDGGAYQWSKMFEEGWSRKRLAHTQKDSTLKGVTLNLSTLVGTDYEGGSPFISFPSHCQS